MRKSICFLLLLLPVAALAQEPQCKHSQPRDLQLDLGGVKTVVFDIGPHELKLDAAPKARAALRGRACASDPEYFAQLKLTQQKIGDKLHVNARREGEWGGFFVRNQYAYLKLAGSVPDDITVQLKVGSGEATVVGAAFLSADVGSGDLQARRIRGLVAAKVGSGDILLEDIGALKVIAVGSGDLEAKRVRGAVEVGSISSGDFTLDGAAGDVSIGWIGSGDARIADIAGRVTIDKLGLGAIHKRDVRGGFILLNKTPGSINDHDIGRPLSLPRQD